QMARRWLRRNQAVMVSTCLAAVIILIGAVVSAWRIVRERNLAEEQREAARATAARLLEDQGRQALLAGDSYRAVASLAEAYGQGVATPCLRFPLATALRDIATAEITIVRPRSVVKRLAFDAGGTRVLVVADDALEIWRLPDGVRLALIRS